MPRARLALNRGLPERWRFQHGCYYYRVPEGMEEHWDNKKSFPLGRTLPEAYEKWAQKIGPQPTSNTLNPYFDRYLLEVVPKKAPKTQDSNRRAIKKLRPVFGVMSKEAVRPRHVYKYVSLRGGVVAHREIEVLSHLFTKIVEWGDMDRHPFKGQVVLQGESSTSRYVEDWEVIECLNLAPRHKKGSVRMIQLYIKLKLLTGMSRGDMLRLQLGKHIREDGIHVTRNKTKSKTGKSTIYTWEQVPERKALVEEIKAIRPALSPFLFCNRRGEGYLNEKTGDANGWKSMWWHFMTRAIKETKLEHRIAEKELRAKVASDADSLERARALLAHADSRTTNVIYRRKPERV